MNHKVNNIQQLYESAVSLYNNSVVSEECSADAILNDLKRGIENLKINWRGKDAGVQIQELIKVYNRMVSFRNILADIAIISSKTAVDYREIQIVSGTEAEPLNVLIDEHKTILDNYYDNSDSIEISQSVEIGRNLIDSTNSLIDLFTDRVRKEYNDIMNNWTSGSGRDVAQNVFEMFLNNINRYKTVLSSVSDNITTALNNYTF